MDDLQGGADEPERADRPERYLPGANSDMGAVRQRVEPRSRVEYAADLEQQAVSGWEQQRSFSSRMGERLDGTNASGSPVDGAAAARPSTDRLNAERLDTPLEAVRRFEPRRAGLPEISVGDAVAYIDAHCGDRPWLAAARGYSPEVQRIFAALDQGGGHAHIRHEGWVTEEMNQRRVAYLEDPAQRDPAKRAAGVDGLTQGDRRHRCGDTATRVTDPDAFAVAFAQGVEHPRVRLALEQEFVRGRRPAAVSVPIDTLLGAQGHQYCTGWRLEPVGESMSRTQDCRAARLTTGRASGAPDTTEWFARPVDTFTGGSIMFVFGPNRERNGYEVVTMYPRVPDNENQG